MNVRFLRLLFHFSRGLALGLCLTGAAAAQDGKVVEFVNLPDLVRDIERAIAEARLVDNEPPFFIIKEVELRLKGSWTEGAEGGFRIPVWIFSVNVEGDITSIETEELAITVVPPDGGLVGGENLVDLTSLVRTLKETFSATSLRGKSISFTRKWILQRSAEADVDAIIMQFGAGISDEKAQSITYHLCQTEDLETCVGED